MANIVLQDKFNMTQEENIFCAKRTLVDSVYKQANLEGIAITYAQTIDILNNVNAKDLTPKDINKVCCLRDGWEFLLTNLDKPIDLGFLETLHEIVARFDVPFQYLGTPRKGEVMISGTSWRPPIPDFNSIHDELNNHLDNPNITDRALKTGLWLMRCQPFQDGNKRICSFLINRILIENGKGLFNVPVEKDGTFKELLVKYYETEDVDELLEYCYNECLEGINEVHFTNNFELKDMNLDIKFKNN